MRQYKIENTTEKVIEKMICNKCGKEIEVKNGIAQEGILSIEKRWDYFSGKDNEVHSFDLCEECYDELVRSFAVPIEKEG